MFQTLRPPRKVGRQARKKPETSLLGIPSGASGTKRTLEIMRGMIRKAKKDFAIREVALDIIGNVVQKDWPGEARAIQQWVKRNIRYARDINGIETLHSPQKILEIGQGDCDDQAMLVSALLESVGFTTRLHAIGFSPNKFAHVFTDAKIPTSFSGSGGGNWVSVETTENWPLGRMPKNVVSHMMVNI